MKPKASSPKRSIRLINPYEKYQVKTKEETNYQY